MLFISGTFYFRPALATRSRFTHLIYELSTVFSKGVNRPLHDLLSLIKPNLLTQPEEDDRISISLRARSSMVEQWPFKPLVKGSSPFALTQYP